MNFELKLIEYEHVPLLSFLGQEFYYIHSQTAPSPVQALLQVIPQC